MKRPHFLDISRIFLIIILSFLLELKVLASDSEEASSCSSRDIVETKSFSTNLEDLSVSFFINSFQIASISFYPESLDVSWTLRESNDFDYLLQILMEASLIVNILDSKEEFYKLAVRYQTEDVLDVVIKKFIGHYLSTLNIKRLCSLINEESFSRSIIIPQNYLQIKEHLQSCVNAEFMESLRTEVAPVVITYENVLVSFLDLLAQLNVIFSQQKYRSRDKDLDLFKVRVRALAPFLQEFVQLKKMERDASLQESYFK